MVCFQASIPCAAKILTIIDMLRHMMPKWANYLTNKQIKLIGFFERAIN